ncbi:MAG: putative DNA binding domain-containing protein, partial [Fibromonadaceae bacterium]|nr:putative DNA binding domain-containing protein [Fibromonadaceae bacterium]
MKNIEVILCDGENYKVEFKESADKSLASEVCAFANAFGGRIFIGVNDNGKIIGTDVSNAARSRIQDTINQIEPKLNVNISIYKNVIIITVPEGNNKPYSCAKGFYLRSGPNSQKLERNSIIEFLQAEGKTYYDSIVNQKFLVKDNFNKIAFETFLRKANISNVLPFEATLVNLGCAEYIGKKLFFTNAGALFFRDNSNDVFFEYANIVCVLYKGITKVDIIDAKELNGGIIENIESTITFLKRHLNIRYEIKTLQRSNILEIPESVLREAVVNAVCHRDYFEIGARIMVEIFDNRVEISNPGGVPKGITAQNFGTLSITRNPVIASLLHRSDYIERMGTGIERMKKDLENAKQQMPEFNTSVFFKITFNRFNSVEKNVPKKVAIAAKKGTEKGTEKITGNQRIILDSILKNPYITSDELSEIVGIRADKIRINLSKLKSK